MPSDTPDDRSFTHTSPVNLKLTCELSEAIAHWTTSQCAVIGLAADFDESNEWIVSGARSAAHWIAMRADIEVSTAREWIRVGRKLRVLPAVAAAFKREQISYSKVRTLTRLATPQNEQELVAIAARVPAGRLGRELAAWTARTADAEGLELHQRQERSVTWRTEPDGMVALSMRLPPLVAGTLVAQLTTTVMRTRANAQGLLERPTLAQQHADALEQMLCTGARVATEVVLHIRGDGCTLDDGTPIPRSVVERVAPDALIRALIHDADSRPINASARQRHPSTRQKRVVKERDRTCVDCGASQLLQFDHVPDFEVSGRTVVDELQVRCAPCHRRRHDAA